MEDDGFVYVGRKGKARKNVNNREPTANIINLPANSARKLTMNYLYTLRAEILNAKNFVGHFTENILEIWMKVSENGGSGSTLICYGIGEIFKSSKSQYQLALFIIIKEILSQSKTIIYLKKLLKDNLVDIKSIIPQILEDNLIINLQNIRNFIKSNNNNENNINNNNYNETIEDKETINEELIESDEHTLDVYIYDPVFKDRDKDFLRGLNINIIAENDNCNYNISSKRTFFFMPHCEKFMYSNLLQTNLNPSFPLNNRKKYDINIIDEEKVEIGMELMIILGNSFRKYEENSLSQNQRKDIAKIMKIIPFTQEIPLSHLHSLPFAQSFNDLSFHYWI